MSQIKSSTSPVSPQLLQQSQQPQAKKETVEAKSSGLIASTDTTERTNKADTKRRDTLTGAQPTLPPPSVANASMSDEQAEGAVSFAYQIKDIGGHTAKNGDDVLAQFMKLMILNAGKDNIDQMTGDMIQRGLRDSAHSEHNMANVYFSNSKAAGTEGAGSLLKNAAEMMKMRNNLLALLSGERPDQVGRREGISEIDTHRNEVSQLVLDLADRHMETNRLTSQFKGV